MICNNCSQFKKQRAFPYFKCMVTNKAIADAFQERTDCPRLSGLKLYFAHVVGREWGNFIFAYSSKQARGMFAREHDVNYRDVVSWVKLKKCEGEPEVCPKDCERLESLGIRYDLCTCGRVRHE